MALDLTSGPYAGPPGSDEAFWNEMAQNWLRSGVIKGKLLEFLVFADSSGRQVKVRTGWAWIQSQFSKHTTDNYVLPIVANSSGVTRFDYVILRNEFALKTITLTTKEGSAGVLPTIQNDAAAVEMALASVTVANGAVTLAAGTVTDLRAFSAPGPVQYYVKGVTDSPAIGVGIAAMPEMVRTIVTRGGDIAVDFYGVAYHSLTGGAAVMLVQLDAGALLEMGGFIAPAPIYSFNVSGKHRFTGVAAGRHTVTMASQTTTGVLTMRGTNRALAIEEVW